MIPISLKLAGIYSYEEEQEVRFDRLLEGQLFGIFGAVGSGKSTILEAMSFALYGETERLNLRDSRGYNMMNLNSQELLVDFIFQAGREETPYRFVVEGKRNSKQFDKVNTFSRKAYRQEQGKWLPIEVATAEEITGLSYQNFRRTIIIPQGKFSEFLQLGDKDRTQMMKEIFQLEEFDLSAKAGQLQSHNQEAINDLLSRLDQLGEVREEALQETTGRIAQLQKEEQQQAASLQTARQLLEQEQFRARQHAEWQALQEQLQQLHDQEPGMRQREQQLDQLERARRDFAPLLEKAAQLEQQQQEVTQQLAALDQQIQIWEVEKGKAVTTLEQAREAADKQAQWRAEAADLQRLSRVREGEQALRALQERLQKGAAFVKEKENILTKLTGRKADLQTGKQSLEKKLPDEETWSAIQSWRVEYQHLQKQQEQLGQQIEKGRQKQADNKAAMLAHMQKLDTAAPELYEDLPGYLQTRKAQLSNQKQKLEEQLRQAELQKELHQYAQDLEEGQPCPLCGATHHPAPLEAGEGTELAQLQAALKALMTQLDLEEQAHAALARCTLSLEALQEQERALIEEETALAQTLAAQQQGCPHEQLRALTDNQQEVWLEEQREGFAQLQALRKSLDAVQEDESQARQVLEQARAKLQSLETELAAGNAAKEALLTQIETITEADTSGDAAQLLQQATTLVEQADAASQRLEQAQQELAGLREQLSVAQGRREGIALQVQTAREELKTIAERLNATLAASPWQQMDEVRRLLALPIEASTERSTIAQFNARLDQTKKLAGKLQADFAANPFDETVFAATRERVPVLEAALQELNAQRVRQEASLEQLLQRQKDRAAFAERLQKLEQRAEDIKVMVSMFKGSGFVNYVSGVMLDEICAAANARFYPLTRQQLQLEVTENNQFVVRDFLHGGRQRSVKTLSGGQTFQASLALALALSERIQQQLESSQNFFFLDEGFGSLDADALQTVFETLKSLRKENRAVGIISHVTDLQREIDVYLQVEREEEGGSQIRASWQLNSG